MGEKEFRAGEKGPGRPQRRRTRDLPACLALLATAAALAGCHERHDCVDRAGHKVPDTYCGGDDASQTGNYFFLYGGRGGRNLGDTVTGGSRTSGFFSRGTVSRTLRGGFGSGGEGGGE